MKWWSQPPVFASARSNAVLSHRCLLPGHQPVRWRLSLLPSSSRTPGLLARRANGARDWIRLCAAMEAATSTQGEHRGSGSIQRSRISQLPVRSSSACPESIHVSSSRCWCRTVDEKSQPENKPGAALGLSGGAAARRRGGWVRA